MLVSCSEAGETPDVSATGPPLPEVALIERHAQQFDEDVPQRPAGSQQEQAASVYITGHLQLAGYVVFLDGVPVADLVRSTNVVARPPSGESPDVVIAAAYDTPPNGTTGGLGLGAFLELARALNVVSPGHGVSFVALGAEHASASGGHLGSRREAQLLLDEEAQPVIVTLGELETDAAIVAAGDVPASLLERLASEAGCDDGSCVTREPLPAGDVFTAAGLQHVRLSGDPGEVALGLLAFLVDNDR